MKTIEELAQLIIDKYRAQQGHIHMKLRQQLAESQSAVDECGKAWADQHVLLIKSQAECIRLRDWLTEEREAALKQQEPVEIDWPEYHEEAMGCGLEDRNITDRYEAMRHGWDCAIEHVASRIPDTLYTAPATDYKPWKDAVEDELVSCCILNEAHTDPRKAIHDAISWNVEVALDPQVSKQASELRETYKPIAERLLSSAEFALTALRILKSNCSEVVWLEESISVAKAAGLKGEE